MERLVEAVLGDAEQKTNTKRILSEVEKGLGKSSSYWPGAHIFNDLQARLC